MFSKTTKKSSGWKTTAIMLLLGVGMVSARKLNADEGNYVYKAVDGCVNGKNMQKLNNISLEDCQAKCNATSGCVGVEYFKASGAWNARNTYEERDCNLSSSINTSGCDVGKWQMYLWEKHDAPQPQPDDDKQEDEDQQSDDDQKLENDLQNNLQNLIDGYKDEFDKADLNDEMSWANPEEGGTNLRGDEFDEDDVFYSNQGSAGTCVRHAVAKGIQREITGYTKGKHAFHTLALVQFLVNHHKNGAGGAFTMWYDGAKGQLVGDGGHIYSLEIEIHPIEVGGGHVSILQLHKFWDNFWPGHDWHAMFNQYSDGKGGLHIRNSWGHSKEWLDVPADRIPDISRAFYIWIKNLTKHNLGRADEVLCENYKWKQF